MPHFEHLVYVSSFSNSLPAAQGRVCLGTYFIYPDAVHQAIVEDYSGSCSSDATCCQGNIYVLAEQETNSIVYAEIVAGLMSTSSMRDPARLRSGCEVV